MLSRGCPLGGGRARLWLPVPRGPLAGGFPLRGAGLPFWPAPCGRPALGRTPAGSRALLSGDLITAMRSGRGLWPRGQICLLTGRVKIDGRGRARPEGAFLGDGREAQGQFKDLGNCLCFPGHDSAKLPLFPQGSWPRVSHETSTHYVPGPALEKLPGGQGAQAGDRELGSFNTGPLRPVLGQGRSRPCTQGRTKAAKDGGPRPPGAHILAAGTGRKSCTARQGGRGLGGKGGGFKCLGTVSPRRGQLRKGLGGGKGVGTWGHRGRDLGLGQLCASAWTSGIADRPAVTWKEAKRGVWN